MTKNIDPNSVIISLRVLETSNDNTELQFFFKEAATSDLLSKSAIDAVNRLVSLISHASGVSPFGVIRSIHGAYKKQERMTQKK